MSETRSAPTFGLADRAVEVKYNAGDDEQPDWSVGSGYMIGGRLVLTCRHCVGTTGDLRIRFRGTIEHPARVVALPSGSLAMDDAIDLAILEILDPVDPRPPIQYARVDPNPPPSADIDGCRGLGFPALAERQRPDQPRRIRESYGLRGYIPLGEGLVEGYLSLRVQDPPVEIPNRDLSGTPWSGISGTVVFAGDLALGVVNEHNPSTGINTLTLTPLSWIDRLADAHGWWALLGVSDPAGLPVLPILKEAPARRFAYAAAVLEMIDPKVSPLSRILAQIEPFPGFPYFSHESDHPSQWPPRVDEDRRRLADEVRSCFTEPVLREVREWHREHPPKLSSAGVPEDDPMLLYAQLRMLLGETGSLESVGPATAAAVARIEATRRDIEEWMPNRLLVLSIRNEGAVTIGDLTVELAVNGSIYDSTLNGFDVEDRRGSVALGRLAVDLPLLRPGYTADVRVWYWTLPLSSRVFAGPRDYEWAQTEGVVVENIAASDVLPVSDPSLLDGLSAYVRFPVDPVRISPTFGRLEIEEAPAPNDSEDEADSEPSADATEDSPAAVPRGAVHEPTATFVALRVYGSYEGRAEALQAQVVLADALNELVAATTAQLSAADGSWIFQDIVPIESTYSRLTASYPVRGELFAILRSSGSVDVESSAGIDRLRRLGVLTTESVPWEAASFEVVLHFFTDPDDSAGDSKRVLTTALPLAEVFDLEADAPNTIAAGFADLLRYVRRSLDRFYGRSFHLATSDRRAPFYLVVRQAAVSENFYLPESWMAVADDDTEVSATAATLRPKISRMYDYADNSRQVSDSEMAAIFGSDT